MSCLCLIMCKEGLRMHGSAAATHAARYGHWREQHAWSILRDYMMQLGRSGTLSDMLSVHRPSKSCGAHLQFWTHFCTGSMRQMHAQGKRSARAWDLHCLATTASRMRARSALGGLCPSCCSSSALRPSGGLWMSPGALGPQSSPAEKTAF
jgi:hypothetical protein